MQYKIFTSRLTKINILLAIIILLAACGGGGSDGGESTPNTSINLNSGNLNFVVRNGSMDTQTVRVNYDGDGVIIGTPPHDPNLPSWLNVSIMSNQYSNPLTVSVTVTSNVTGYPGTPGRYNATIRFVTGRVDGSNISYVDLPIVFDLYTPVAVDTTEQKVPMYNGANNSLQTNTIDINGSNTPWTAQSNSPWLQISNLSGRSPSKFSYTIDASLLPIGVANGIVTIHDDNENVSFDIPITVHVQPHRLMTNKNGIAFSSMPNRNTLSTDVDVLDNAGTVVQWNATTTTNWINLAQSNGVTPGNFTISADPSTLAPGLHYASIDVTSTDGSITNTETINVGFYISTTDSITTGSTVISTSPTNYVRDIIRPYIYLSYGTNRIDVYNVHTGDLVNTITLPKGTELIGAMTPSDDGNHLYAIDNIDNSILKIELQTNTVATTFTSQGFVNVVYDMKFSRIQGYPLLIIADGRILNADTGVQLTTFPAVQYVVIRNNSNRFFATHYGFNWGRNLNEIELYATPQLNVTVTELDNSSLAETRSNCDETASYSANGYYIVCQSSSILAYNNNVATIQYFLFLGPTGAEIPVSIEALSEDIVLLGMTSYISPYLSSELMLFNLINSNQSLLVLDSIAANSSMYPRSMLVSSDMLRVTALHYLAAPQVAAISFTDLP